MKKIRILPKGFALIMIVLFICVFALAQWMRTQSPSSSLSYDLNRTNLDEFSGHFSLKTMGDAVNYEVKDIFEPFEIRFEYDTMTLLKKASNERYHYRSDLYSLNGTEETYQAIKSNYFLDNSVQLLFTELVKKDTVFDELIKEYEHQLLRIYRDSMTSNGDEITIAMSLEEFIDNFESTRKLLFKDSHTETYFKTFVKAAIYESYNADDISKQLIHQYSEIVLEKFSKASEIYLKFISNQEGFITLDLDMKLHYLDCDAFEWVQIKLNF